MGEALARDYTMKQTVKQTREAAMTSVSIVPLPRRAASALAFIVTAHIVKKRKGHQQQRRRRWWLREIFRKRLQYGNRLIKDMQMEMVEDIILNFTRMKSTDFDYLVLVIGPKIEPVDTHMREAITVKERIAITLRYLATGDSYTSLQ
ncbi:hypothetical protein GE061_009747 [Apolygus lucorum]|uniref:Uncharacterized protein n=1 Tax=Apolygus lucorum TaxID=248454 RepID=A0A6A4KCA6_APOLU|nr:hypothetical protein GE061_009747 [Apolygus lucorum]